MYRYGVPILQQKKKIQLINPSRKLPFSRAKDFRATQGKQHEFPLKKGFRNSKSNHSFVNDGRVHIFKSWEAFTNYIAS